MDTADDPCQVRQLVRDVHVDVAPAEVRVEPAITVEPARIEEGAISVTVEPSAAPNVDVRVEPPQVNIERSKARRVDFADGRQATITEGEQKTIRYDDGTETTITEVDE